MDKLLTTNINQKRSYNQLVSNGSSPMHKGLRSAKNSMSTANNIGKLEAVIEKNKMLIDKHNDNNSDKSSAEQRPNSPTEE